MRDDGGETEAGRGAERGRATDRGERDEGKEAWRIEMFVFLEVLDRGLNE